MSGEIYIRDVAYTLPNATGAFTITDTGGPGLTPKAAMIVLTGATALSTETDTARVCIGLTDGTSSIAMSWLAEDGIIDVNADTGRRRATDKILNLTAITTEALAVGATFTSFGTNSMTINMEHASTLIGWVRFFYGANLSAKVTTVLGAATSNSSVNSPSLGFPADGCIVISARNNWNTDVGLANAIISMGCAGRLPSISQACIGIVAEDRESPTSVGTLIRNNRVLSVIESIAGVVTQAVSIEVTAFNADDIEFTTRDGSEAIGIGILAFSIGGEKVMADCPTLNADAMGVSSYTGAGFRARALMLIGQGATVVGTISPTHGAMSLGCASGSTINVEPVAKWNDLDAQSTSRSTCALFLNSFLHVEGHWAARLHAITPTGFDYNVIVTAASDLPTVVMSIGEQPGDQGWMDAIPGRRWRRCLGRR